MHAQENDLGDSLYMLIPHGPGSALEPHAPTSTRLGHLSPEQIQAMHRNGIALPPCVGDCKRFYPSFDFDPRYHGFHGAIAQRQHEYMERSDDELHWARTGM